MFLSLLSYEPRSRAVGRLHCRMPADVKCKKCKKESSSCRLSTRNCSSGVPELHAPHVGLIQGPTLPHLFYEIYTASLNMADQLLCPHFSTRYTVHKQPDE